MPEVMPKIDDVARTVFAVTSSNGEVPGGPVVENIPTGGGYSFI
jgi:hypothetical protein